MKNVRWGVLSTAKIGLNKVIPGMQRAENCLMVGIASRDEEKARSAAESLGLPRAYGSYEELLADSDIEAVYNPLPNHLHVDWSIRALEAGKHVLCEKPLGLDAKDAQRLLDAAKSYPELKVMEAFMYRFHPQWVTARSLVESGDIGELRAIQTCFSYFNDNPSDIRNQADIGGGGLLDIGCYCISLSRFLFGKKPDRVTGIVDIDPTLRTDILTSGLMDFGVGTSIFTCSTQLEPYQRVHIVGTSGRIEIEIPFNAPTEVETRLWLIKRGETEEIQIPISDQYTLQGEAFSKSILEDVPVPTPLSDAIENLEIIDALFASGKRSEWITL